MNWANHWGNPASILGLLVSIVGFGVTIFQVIRSRKAATAAAQAAAEARNALIMFEAVADFSSVIAAMEELRRLHRAGAWPILPDRYSTLRQRLVEVRAAGKPLSEANQVRLQTAIQHLSMMEKHVEKYLAEASTVPNKAKFNELISNQIDGLTEVLTSLRIEAAS
jgi:hypothetical protein